MLFIHMYCSYSVLWMLPQQVYVAARTRFSVRACVFCELMRDCMRMRLLRMD